MLHQRIIEKYQIRTDLLPTKLQGHITHAAKLQERADKEKVYRYQFDQSGLNEQDRKVLSQSIEQGSVTIGEGLTNDPPLFVAKSVSKNFGLPTYSLWLGQFNFKTVTEGIYNAVQLPNIDQFKMGIGPANTDPENVAEMLKQVDGNISMSLMDYLRGNMDRLGDFVGGGSDGLTAYKQDDLTELVARAFGKGFFENGELVENYGYFGKEGVLVKTENYRVEGEVIGFITIRVGIGIGQAHLERMLRIVTTGSMLLPYEYRHLGEDWDVGAFQIFGLSNPIKSKRYNFCLGQIKSELKWLEMYQEKGEVTDMKSQIAMLKMELN